MKVEQFVMAYKVEQDRIRAMLPEDCQSLRPVMRINAEIREDKAYIEFNTPVEFQGKRGWMNIENWCDGIQVTRNDKATTFKTDFLEITYTSVGISGGCPAERDNNGCFYNGKLVPPEAIDSNKEFCDCTFAWGFNDGDAHGISIGGKTLPATPTELINNYPRKQLTAENAAAIPCLQMLGQYKVIFERR